jgi:hypothetical protein
MQLKAKVNNRAKAVGISPAHAMQVYVLDCLVVRLSRSGIAILSSSRAAFS